jgi:3-hydroxyacyl-CoA dehydrogenase
MIRVNKAAVLGAGTMGAQIAAHLVNAGIPTLLLDIVPSENGAVARPSGKAPNRGCKDVNDILTLLEISPSKRGANQAIRHE